MVSGRTSWALAYFTVVNGQNGCSFRDETVGSLCFPIRNTLLKPQGFLTSTVSSPDRIYKILTEKRKSAACFFNMLRLILVGIYYNRHVIYLWKKWFNKLIEVWTVYLHWATIPGDWWKKLAATQQNNRTVLFQLRGPPLHSLHIDQNPLLEAALAKPRSCLLPSAPVGSLSTQEKLFHVNHSAIYHPEEACWIVEILSACWDILSGCHCKKWRNPIDSNKVAPATTWF